ncbi:MAG: NifB/NifX family molybdenum-iron cluster-binding protein [Acidobacteriota bacterium]|jgi:predicted Fe-Mo cluster-binding NifX family protein
MNICIPVTDDKGLESPVSAHFGSAPFFLVVNTENGSCRAVSNRNLNHGHGMCQPLLSLAGERVDGMVVGGIGMGALGKFQAANIQVYLSEFPTAAATVAAFKDGKLKVVTPQTACGRHGGHNSTPRESCQGRGGSRS